ncbi:MAG TPA: hypothetical protein PK816_07080 [Candidatus Cloacimonadota bacterium]|nr:hypothetical protein [Sedimentibacter sp.]HPM01908.1 hypothetical protein [Candidatus Cloacimonadota bacterium]
MKNFLIMASTEIALVIAMLFLPSTTIADEYSSFKRTVNENGTETFVIPVKSKEGQSILKLISTLESPGKPSPSETLKVFSPLKKDSWDLDLRYLRHVITGDDPYYVYYIMFTWQSKDEDGIIHNIILAWSVFLDNNRNVKSWSPDASKWALNGELVSELSEDDSWELAKLICSGEYFK